MDAADKKKYKVVYNRSDCIGVLTCAAFYPERWLINKDDSKADLRDGRETEKGIFELEFSEGELEQFKKSAEVCPVKVIEVFDIETGEKLS